MDQKKKKTEHLSQEDIQMTNSVKRCPTSLVIKEVQKTTGNTPYLLEYLLPKGKDITIARVDLNAVENLNPLCTVGEIYKLVQPLWKTICADAQKLKIAISLQYIQRK